MADQPSGPIAPDGPPAPGSAALAGDQAERRRAAQALAESEARFRELADAMPQIVFVVGADLRAQYVNAQWQQFTGRAGTGLEELRAAIHADDWQPFADAWQHATRTGDDLAVELRLERSDGQYRWFLVRATAVRGAGGGALRWYATATNIDFQKRHAESLRRAHAALQEADRRKDLFLATLAHELRNPLAPLRTSLQVLQLTASAEVSARVKRMMQQQLDHLVRLVDDLLDIARISSGKVDLQKAVLPLRAVLDAAIDESRPAIDAAQHRLQLDLDDGLEVEADFVRLTQVFVNLLLNAAKYTGAGGAIRVVSRRDGDDAVVTVADNGRGIEPAMLERIFEPFVQAEQRDAVPSASGLGIGLALVHSLVKLHGGLVQAHSEGPGRGSEFCVRLPLAAAPANAAVVAPPAESPLVAPQGLRVLVCDDNQDAGDSLGILLDCLGARSRVVYRGEDALREAQAFRPQVLLLDLGMPGMSGYDVARELQAMPGRSDMVLVALTGWGQERDRQRTRDAGFDRHLIKPVELRDLQAVLGDAAASAASAQGALEKR